MIYKITVGFKDQTKSNLIDPSYYLGNNKYFTVWANDNKIIPFHSKNLKLMREILKTIINKIHKESIAKIK